MISLQDIEVSKRGKRLLGPLSHTFGEDGITAILGTNGAGKTTLLRLCHGMERVRAGRMEKREELRGAFVFQTPTVLRRSVLENVSYPLRLRRQKRDAAMLWVERAGLADRAEAPAFTLSGGERQRMALARALVATPDVLFLDEPTSNLDGPSTRLIEALVRDAAADGTRVLMATHDLGQVRRLANDVLFLHAGQALETCDAKAFLDAPKTPQGRAYVAGDIVE
ncbi:MAG: ATP-binding cassette domain-containing protein [Pseudomonadota bacterium]